MDMTTQVVHLYYQRNMTQQQIANRFGVSKMTISRMLKKAEEDGLVEIRIHLPINNEPHLEAELKKRFHFKNVFVTYPPDENLSAKTFQGELLLDFLGRSTALYIDSLLRDNMIVGIALGKTIGYVVRHLPQKNLLNSKVVQLLGGFGTSSNANPYDLVHLISHRFNAEGIYFSGPAFVDSLEIKEALLAQHIHDGLQELWDRCDLALMSIGNCSLQSSYVLAGQISSQDIEEIRAEGAVGDIVGHFYDSHGTFFKPKLYKQVNAIPLESLKKVKQIVVTAGGLDKVQSLLGLSRTGIPVSLVTDLYTADAMLAASNS